MKLTPKQKEVIRLMRDGNTLKKRSMHPYGWTMVQVNGMSSKVTSSTCYVLLDKKLITRVEEDTFTHVFGLTELGNTINIEL